MTDPAPQDPPQDPPPNDPPADPPDPPTPPPADDDAPLGPEGEKALEAWKQRAKAAERDAKRAGDLEAELTQLREEQMGEHERAIEQARREAREEAEAELTDQTTRRLFGAELKVAASGDIDITDDEGKTHTVRLADPSLLADTEVALRLLDLDEIPVTNTGDIDSEAISQAVTTLVTAKPYLAASATPQPGSADQGARTAPPKKGLEDQIREAEANEDWALAGRLKMQKLAAAPPP